MESEDPEMIIGDDASLHEQNKERWYGSVKRLSISEVNCNFVMDGGLLYVVRKCALIYILIAI